MIKGLLWFDNSKQTNLHQKLLRAMDYYIKKYDVTPNLYLINTAGMEEGDYPITVRPYRPVLPGHLWIGVEDDNL